MSINQRIRTSPQSDNLREEVLEYDHWAFEVRVLALHCFQILLEVIRARGKDEIMFRSTNTSSFLNNLSLK